MSNAQACSNKIGYKTYNAPAKLPERFLYLIMIINKHVQKERDGLKVYQ